MGNYSDYIKESFKKKLEEQRKKNHPEKYLKEQEEKRRLEELKKKDEEMLKEHEKQEKKPEQEKRKTKEEKEKILQEVSKLIKKDIIKPVEKGFEEIEKGYNILKKRWIILGSLIILAAVLIVLFILVSPPIKSKFNPLDISASNSSGLNMPVFYKNKQLFSFSGWESILEYNNKSDRIFGNEQYKKIVFDNRGKAYTFISLDNQIRVEPLKENPEKVTKIGWFYKPEQFSFNEEKTRNEKSTRVKLSEGEIIKNSEFLYTFYKNKPYFKMEFSAAAENSELFGYFAYGFVIKEYDIVLPNGTLIKNDNEIIPLNKTTDIVLNENGKVTKNISDEIINSISQEADLSRQAIQRKGSDFEANTDYEIFYNEKERLALIIYSPYAVYFSNSFYWNVYRIYVPYNYAKESYEPVYVFIFDNVVLKYQGNDWLVVSDQYTGSINYYIDDVFIKLEAEVE